MVTFQDLKPGQKVLFSGEEMDGSFSVKAEVTEVFDDHAIAKGDGMNLWIGKFNADMFTLI